MARLGERDRLAEIAEWIGAIPLEEWPQQHRLRGELRPAMVSDPAWLGFGAVVRELTANLLDILVEMHKVPFQSFNPMLSVVMPGHDIEAHRDHQQPDWAARVHVPLLTNDRAVLLIDGERHQLEVGRAYLVNTTLEHAVRNDGFAPRVHYMFDVRRPG